MRYKVVPSDMQLRTSYALVQTSLLYNIWYSHKPLSKKIGNCGTGEFESSGSV